MAITDKFRKGKSNYAATLSVGIGTGTGDTITLSSAAGLPTDTEITLTFNRVDSDGNVNATNLMERITGTISGSTLTEYTRGVDNTTEQAHGAGTVVEYIWNGTDLNDITDGILVEHGQDGTHAATIVKTTVAQTLTNKTLTSPVLTTPQVNDTTADHQYVVAVSELGADRTVTLPLLTGNDEFVFKAHAQTLTNKTNVSRVATYAPAGAGTTTLDLSTGNTHIVTMPAAAQTLAISNGTVGQWFNVQINNVTSQGALTWFTTIRWMAGIAGTLCGTNGKRDSFIFYVSGAGTYDGYIVGNSA